MNDHGQHKHHHPGSLFAPPPAFNTQLEPDYGVVIDYQIVGIAGWTVLAGVDVSTSTELWTVNPAGAASLDGAINLRLTAYAPGTAPKTTGNPETAPTAVTWATPLSGDEAYTGITFEGEYPMRTSTKLAIGFHIVRLSGGDMTIDSTDWFNPTSSPVKATSALLLTRTRAASYTGTTFYKAIAAPPGTIRAVKHIHPV